MQSPLSFDFCRGCFSLRTATAPRRWVAPNARQGRPEELSLDGSSARTVFYHIFQGTFGMPGSAPSVYLLAAEANLEPDVHLCLWQQPTLGWSPCPSPSDCGMTIDCDDLGYEAVLASGGFVLRRSGCSAAASCSYVSPLDAHTGSLSMHMMPTVANASVFEAVCEPCPAAPLGPFGAALVAAILLIAALPLLARVRACCLARRRRRATPASAWPRRPRSEAAWACFQLGWMLAVLGVTPDLLWSTGRWWAGSSASDYQTTALVPFGFLLMNLAIRPDDSAQLIRSVGGRTMPHDASRRPSPSDCF